MCNGVPRIEREGTRHGIFALLKLLGGGIAKLIANVGGVRPCNPRPRIFGARIERNGLSEKRPRLSVVFGTAQTVEDRPPAEGQIDRVGIARLFTQNTAAFSFREGDV